MGRFWRDAVSANIGRIRLRLETTPLRRAHVEGLAGELRSNLPDALAAALASRSDDAVLLVPRMKVTVRAPLGRVRGLDLAGAIAEACVEAALARSVAVETSGDHGTASTAHEIVERLRSADGVRCRSSAEEAAAWLVGLVLDERSDLRACSPFADLQNLPTGAALIEVCSRVGDARSILGALGERWSLLFASRCSDAEARHLLRLLATGEEPNEITWAFVAAQLAAPQTVAVALRTVVEGVAASIPGVARAALSILASPSTESGVALASELTGFWLLLPHLARRIYNVDERAARGIALGLAERLAPRSADDDPAVQALCNVGELISDLRAAIPPDIRIDRLLFATIRDFARTLSHFEGASCGYVRRAILNGPGAVRQTPEGWSATLPRSPLRIVLERASLLGAIHAPWSLPRLTIVRDDE